MPRYQAGRSRPGVTPPPAFPYQRLVDAIAAATTGDELEFLRAAARTAAARDGRLAGLEAEIDARRRLLTAGRAFDAELRRAEGEAAAESQEWRVAMTPDIKTPVDEGSSLDEVIAWITELARLHRAHSDDANAVRRIHAAARHALALFEHVLTGEVSPPRERAKRPGDEPTE